MEMHHANSVVTNEETSLLHSAVQLNKQLTEAVKKAHLQIEKSIARSQQQRVN